jgi:pimeloyl-ACP methyl ester carboxylesterase
LQGQARETIIAAQHAAAPQWAEGELGPWADSKLRFNPVYFDDQSGSAIDWPSLLADIRCPVLLLTGDPALGAIVTDQQAAALSVRVPQVKRAHIPGAGHNLRRDQFELYLKALGPRLAAWSAAP